MLSNNIVDDDSVFVELNIYRNNTVDDGNIGELSSVYLDHLQPPSQLWLHNQLNKILAILGWTYTPPSHWKQCKTKITTYYLPKLNTIFTVIPKAGCTNWKRALLVAEGTMKDNSSLVHETSDKHSLQATHHKFTDDVLKEAFSFVVIRNPWTRLVSGYQDKLSNTSNNAYYRGLGKQIVKEFRVIGWITKALFLENLYPTFEEFLKYLIKMQGKVDHHFKPQNRIMCLPECRYDYIVPLEYADVMSQEIWGKIKTNTTLRAAYDQIQDPRQQSSTLLAKEWVEEMDNKVVDDIYRLFKADFVLAKYSNITDPNFPLPL